MLRYTSAKQKIQLNKIHLQALTFEDNSFDCYTIAFGIRNVVKIDAALREARRVLKPGGRFLCLEFSKVITKSKLKYSFGSVRSSTRSCNS